MGEPTMTDIAAMIKGVGATLEAKVDTVMGVVTKLSSRTDKQEETLNQLQEKMVVMEEQLKETREELKPMKGEKNSYAKVVAGPTGVDHNKTTSSVSKSVELEEAAEESEDDKKKSEIVERSRRTIGFETITEGDIARMYKEQYGGAKDLEEAKICAVKEYMSLEMKIKEELDIVKVFAPRREGANILYCEFSEFSSVQTVYRHTKCLGKHARIHMFVPPQFYDRYSALQSICHTWRREENYKTRVRMGKEDLQVLRKKRGEPHYTMVKLHELGELPAVNLTREAGTGTGPTDSPAPGRPGAGAGGKRRRSKATNSSVGESPPPKRMEGTAESDDGESVEPSAKTSTEDDFSKKLEAANLVSEATITPVKDGAGLLPVPQAGRVTEILGTPTRESSDVSSPVFTKAKDRKVKN